MDRPRATLALISEELISICGVSSMIILCDKPGIAASRELKSGDG